MTLLLDAQDAEGEGLVEILARLVGRAELHRGARQKAVMPSTTTWKPPWFQPMTLPSTGCPASTAARATSLGMPARSSGLGGTTSSTLPGRRGLPLWAFLAVVRGPLAAFGVASAAGASAPASVATASAATGSLSTATASPAMICSAAATSAGSPASAGDSAATISAWAAGSGSARLRWRRGRSRSLTWRTPAVM